MARVGVSGDTIMTLRVKVFRILWDGVKSFFAKESPLRVRFGDCVFDGSARELRRAGQPVHLPPKSFQLLELLLSRRPLPVTKAEIRDALWPATAVGASSLARVVVDLRSAIGDDARRPRLLRTVHGFGYSFSGETVLEQPPGPERLDAWPVGSSGESARSCSARGSTSSAGCRTRASGSTPPACRAVTRGSSCPRDGPCSRTSGARTAPTSGARSSARPSSRTVTSSRSARSCSRSAPRASVASTETLSRGQQGSGRRAALTLTRSHPDVGR